MMRLAKWSTKDVLNPKGIDLSIELKLDDAAEYLGMSSMRLQRLADFGEVEATNGYVFTKAVLVDYLRRHQ
jgi:hypothetical protein